jgi:hypothetical protein
MLRSKRSGAAQVAPRREMLDRRIFGSPAARHGRCGPDTPVGTVQREPFRLISVGRRRYAMCGYALAIAAYRCLSGVGISPAIEIGPMHRCWCAKRDAVFVKCGPMEGTFIRTSWPPQKQPSPRLL